MNGTRFLLCALLLATCVAFTEQALLPSGVANGDTQALFSDEFSVNVPLAAPIIIASVPGPSSFDLNMNGYAISGGVYPDTTPRNLPLAGSLSNAVLLAPFLANVDTSSGGTLFYRTESSSGHSFDTTLRTLFSSPSFTSNNRFIATWQAVRHQGTGTTTNTFQLGLFASATETYVCYNYGAMAWDSAATEGGTNGLGGLQAMLGINSGTGSGFTSYTRNGAVASLTAAAGSNTGTAGQYCASLHRNLIRYPCTATDNVFPTITCPGTSFSANSPPDRCEAEIIIPQPAYNDNCGVSAYRTSYFTPFPVGVVTDVFFNYQDGSGRTQACSNIRIEVRDVTDPQLVCPDELIAGTPDATQCRFLASLNDIVVSDNCFDVFVTQTSGIQNGTFIETPGTYPISFNVADNSGNTVSCSTSFQTQDTAAPLVDCIPLTYTTPASSCSVPFPSDFLSAAVTRVQDNCDASPLLEVTPRSLPRGTTNVAITASDVTGNEAVCTSVVTVEDRTPPIITCPLNQLYPADASCRAVLNLPSPTITDNCDSGLTANIVSGPASGTTQGLGTYPVTYQVSDSSFNSNICRFNATVEDRSPPDMTCQSSVTALARDVNQGACTATIRIPTPTTTDNCGVTGITQTGGPSNNSVVTLGTYFLTFRALDVGQNFDDCTVAYTAFDTTAPVILCNTVVYNAPPDACELPLPIDFIQNSISRPIDNCDPAPSTSVEPGTILFLGDNEVFITVSDASDNIDGCLAIAILEDVTPPVIDCPLGSVTVPTLPGTCTGIFSLGAITATDNCDDITPVQISGPTPGSNTGRGDFTAVFEALDAANNRDECSIDVSIVDGEDPVINCPSSLSFVSTSPTLCSAPVSYATPSVSDNCDSGLTPTVASGPLSGQSAPVGTSFINFSVFDLTGNQGTCTTTVTVTDSSPPRGTCAPLITLPTATGQCGTPFPSNFESLALSGLADNCGTPTASYSQPFLNRGDTPITVTFTDSAGLTSQCTTVIRVVDNTDPSASCPANGQQFFTNSDSCSGPVTLSNPSGTDNCGVASAVFTDFSNGLFSVGSHVANALVTDTSGNTDTCSTTFSVIDNDNPVTGSVPCPSAPITAVTGAGVCNAIVNFPLPNFTDNCGLVVNNYNSIAPGGTFPRGTTNAVVYVEDAAGNSNSCSFSVVVTDNQPPVIDCAPSNLVTAPGQCTAPPVAPSYTDNCATNTISTSFVGNLAIGPNTVPWTATDVNGNSATCDKVITVVDNQPPTIECKNITVPLVSPSFSSTIPITALYQNLVDNCPIVSDNVVANRTLTFGYDDTNSALTYVRVTATDASGNTGSCVSRVNVTLTSSIITDPTNGSIRFIGQSFTIRWFQLPGLDPNRKCDIWLANNNGVFIKYLVRGYLFKTSSYSVNITGVKAGFYQIHMILQGAATEVPFVTIELRSRI